MPSQKLLPPTQQPPQKRAKCEYYDSVCTKHSSPPKPVVVIEDQSEVIASQQTALQIALGKAKTRAEDAALYSIIPPLCRALCALKVVFGKPSSCDPFSIAERPCESDIQRAKKLLHEEQKTGKNPTGVEFEGLGQFSENAIRILTDFCKITETHHKVSAKANWLLQMKFTPRHLVQLQDVLWHHSSTRPILTHGRKGIDATSFSDLVGERYIDSFVIDICISKFLDEARLN